MICGEWNCKCLVAEVDLIYKPRKHIEICIIEEKGRGWGHGDLKSKVIASVF